MISLKDLKILAGKIRREIQGYIVAEHNEYKRLERLANANGFDLVQYEHGIVYMKKTFYKRDGKTSLGTAEYKITVCSYGVPRIAHNCSIKLDLELHL